MLSKPGRPARRPALLVTAATATSLLSAAPALAAPATPAGAAQQSSTACTIFNDLFFNETARQIGAGRERVCSGDPEDTFPLNTVITRNGVTVASGLGGAIYRCEGTAMRTYRLKNSTLQVTAPCS